MTGLAPEKRAELRAAVEERHLFRFATERGSDGYPSSGLLEISREVLALLDERDRLAAAAERVRALHVGGWGCGNPSHTNPAVSCPDCFMECACGEMCPCPTLRALDDTDDGPTT